MVKSMFMPGGDRGPAPIMWVDHDTTFEQDAAVIVQCGLEITSDELNQIWAQILSSPRPWVVGITNKHI